MIQFDPETETNCSAVSQAARKLHAEDVCVGDYVAIADVTYEYASFLWNCFESYGERKDQLVRVNYMAHDDFDVFRVKSICLPFVQTTNTKKKNRVFDLRKTNLFRLSAEFATSYKKGSKLGIKKKCKKKRGKRKSK